MSDAPMGPGWFQAADGKWYAPPPQGLQPPPAAYGAPPGQPGQWQGQPTPPPKKKEFPIWIVIGAVGLCFLGIVAAFGSAGSKKDAAPTTAAAASPSTTTTLTEAPAGDASTSTEAPTTAPPTEPPTTKPPTTKAPTVARTPFAGTGDFVIKLPAPITDAALVTMTHGGARNFAVKALTSSGSTQDLLVNTIGAYSGTQPVNFRDGQSVAAFEIAADGPWTFTLDDITTAPVASSDVGARYDGIGDQVVIFRAQGGLTTLDFACPGCTGNVTLQSYGKQADLLVNEIGAYSGSVRVPEGTLVLVIGANNTGFNGGGGGASWSFTVT